MLVLMIRAHRRLNAFSSEKVYCFGQLSFSVVHTLALFSMEVFTHHVFHMRQIPLLDAFVAEVCNHQRLCKRRPCASKRSCVVHEQE